MDTSSITPGPEGLRALSHPLRLRMLGLLRVEGPATATTLSERLGINTGATSYHLRQLAQHGFIEDDPDRGNARDRWWRAAHASTQARPTDAQSQEERDSYDAFLQAVVVFYIDGLRRAVELEATLPKEWAEAGTFSDWILRLTPARAADLKQALAKVLEEFVEDDEDTPGALPFVVNINAYLQPDAADRL
jgi:DNA-binding transcriptional ArsR family regulator